MPKRMVLQQYFGYDDFRPGQEPLIDGILAGRDVLGIMPTGGGKSMCYQIPALLLPGLTLVVSPLISLMKDQVAALNGAGIPAALLNSSLDEASYRETCWQLRQGMHKLLYVAPERLENEGFLRLMQEQEISMIAVDEAHCISQWGQDFRPSYLKIPDFVAKLPHRPVVSAFTATATAEVQADIVQRLELIDPVKIVTGFDRPNLYFEVRRPTQKLPLLTQLVEDRAGRSGIIYCATRANVEKVCDHLRQRGIPATRYHAGLSEAERRQNQDDFQFDRAPVMVATNAFGMGIDKSNVGYVIHYNMPKSLEAYYQEAGRAGRDGEPADCILLFSPGDVETAKFFIQNSGSEELDQEAQERIRRRDYERLRIMVGYCRTTGCFRGYILDYFGQKHAKTCENCGSCKSMYQHEDITVAAQMALSCVRRVREHLGYYVGKTLIVQTLRGSRDRRVLQLGLDTLSTYGLMRQLSAEKVRGYLDFLEAEGYLQTNPDHFTLEPTAAASAVLFGGREVSMPVRLDQSPENEEKTVRRREPSLPAAQAEALFETLRASRAQIAREESVPAYIVFSNAALADMAAKAPGTMAEFLQVSGVGAVKAARYGERFLRVIVDHREKDG